MRVRIFVVTSLVLQSLAWTLGCGSTQAQTDGAPTSAFLDFGLPCKDPLPESDLPKLLDAARVAPKSNPARPLTSPPYPALARRLGEEGTAVMRLLITESGEVSQAHIAESTGSPRLDSAALEETRNWRLQPGLLDGKPRCMWGKFAASFVLKEYGDAELSAVNVGPEARQLAHHLMSVDQLKEILLKSEAGAVERQMVTLVLDAAGQRREWIDAEERVARILAFEFSTAELVELEKFFGSPVAAKWMSLNLKMMTEVSKEQQLVTQTFLCSLQGLDREMKQDKSAVVDGKITEKHQQAISGYVDAAIPYCACLFDRMKKKGATTAASKTVAQCGLPPSFE